MQYRLVLRPVIAGLAALAVIVAGLTPAAAQSSDDRIKRQQAPLLDPQADKGNRVQLPDPHVHHHHTDQAGTRQAAGVDNTLQAAVAGSLAPAVGGQWSYLPPLPTTFNGTHAITGPNGKLLLIAGSGNSAADFKAGTFQTFVIDKSGARRQVPTPKDLFCGGHTLLPDGRALVFGGTTSYSPFKGSRNLYAFNFSTERYEKLTPLEVGRWYPTGTQMWDGRTLIAGGLDDNGANTTFSEVFDYRTNKHVKVGAGRKWPLYPQIIQSTGGRLFFTGGGSGKSPVAPGFWEPFKGNTFKPVTGLPVPGQRAASANCFFGDVRQWNQLLLGGGWPATNSVGRIKLDAATPVYTAGPSLPAPKAYLNCVSLPDGTLLEAGGGTANTIAGASREVSQLRSLAGPWQPMNPLPEGEHRLYHSMEILLDNGQVLSVTSNPTDGPRSNSVLVYSPPYLFRGTRPVIKTSPATVHYGQTYSITGTAAAGSSLTHAVLTPAVSTTHASDVNQRYVAQVLKNGSFYVPNWRSALPPGKYRLWLRDSAGRVSAARWLTLS